MRRIWPAAVGALMFACQPGKAPDAAGAAGTAAAQVVVEGAPTPDEVLRALLASTDVPLSVDSSCAGVGASLTDRTIGDFLAGFLAAYADSSGTNWLRVASDPVSERGERLWRNTVVLHRRAPDEVWGWGVRFDLLEDRRVVRSSFRCIG